MHIAQGLRNLFQAVLDLLRVVLEERDEHAFLKLIWRWDACANSRNMLRIPGRSRRISPITMAVSSANMRVMHVLEVEALVVVPGAAALVAAARAPGDVVAVALVLVMLAGGRPSAAARRSKLSTASTKRSGDSGQPCLSPAVSGMGCPTCLGSRNVRSRGA